jgi:chromosomal replication initiator protein
VSSAEQRNPWDFIKDQLRRTFSAESFENWIARTKFAAIDGKTLLVTVPDKATARLLLEEYSARINAVAVSTGLGLERVEFKVDTNGRVPGLPGAEYSSNSDEGDIESPLPLNPKFTFDSFVVGSCNQFAHAAAQSVAMNPSRSYNPLFLYGGVGMGKTHLIHAIGRALTARGKLRIIFTTSERFTNEVVAGIKHERMAQVRARYRSADVLLIDDIQSLGTKERTQEEFFHTFNTLYQGHKQIILSADCPPGDIPELEERLVSRFNWGLVARIEKPTYETRVAILQKKAKIRGLTLPEDVVSYIAGKLESNTRELEGAITTLQGMSSAHGRVIDLEMVKSALGDNASTHQRQITIQQILEAVTKFYNVKLSELQSKKRHKSIAFPRQVCMFLARRHTRFSLEEIGGYFGGRDHTTVLHAVRTVDADCKSDTEVSNQLTQIENQLSAS